MQLRNSPIPLAEFLTWLANNSAVAGWLVFPAAIALGVLMVVLGLKGWFDERDLWSLRSEWYGVVAGFGFLLAVAGVLGYVFAFAA